MPEPAVVPLARIAGLVGALAAPAQRDLVARNQQRVGGSYLRGPALQRAVLGAYTSYARYWLESFRLPNHSDRKVDEGHDVVGFDHVLRAREAGRGVILALPHLGGWEWSAFWLARIENIKVTAVVEPLEPAELFEWFVSFRRSLGMNIVPLGPEAGREVLAALKRNEIVCLLADRDLAGTGIDVDFFGERTTLPAGPATLAFRSGAPLLPTAVYFRKGFGHLGVVQPPIDLSRQSSLRDDIGRATQDLAAAFEVLIRAAPEQWHLFQRNWPSDG